jgi:hypothetical protein
MLESLRKQGVLIENKILTNTMHVNKLKRSHVSEELYTVSGTFNVWNAEQ